MTKYIETVVAVLVGVGLLLLGTYSGDATIHDGGVLVLGYSTKALIGALNQ